MKPLEDMTITELVVEMFKQNHPGLVYSKQQEEKENDSDKYGT